MPAPLTRERTIAFFEVVEQTDGQQARFEQADWQEVLRDLQDWDIGQRRTQASRDLIGETYYSGERSLLLHRVKGDDEWLARADFSTGNIEQLEALAAQGYLDSSVVHFAGFGNIVGLMQGSTSAPTHSMLQEWLNTIQPLGPIDLVVRPVMSTAEIERLQQAGGVQRVDIKVGHLNAAETHGRLADSILQLRQYYEDADVTISIAIPRGREFAGRQISQYRELYDDVQGLGPAITSADRARVNLVYMDGDHSGQRRIAELVEHHITAKRFVPVTNAEGEVVRIYGAVSVIRGVIEEHADELTNAVLGDD